MVRIAICGNIAGNAYLLAKFLQRLGVEAHSFDTGGGNPMWLPWWEDADFDPAALHPSHYDWASVAASTGVPRPPWAKILGADGAAPWYDTQEAYQADLCRIIPGAIHHVPGQSAGEAQAEAAAALAASRLTPDEQRACLPGLLSLQMWRGLRELGRHYDLLVLMGPFAAAAPALDRGVPYVTFEHSTMRQVPLLDTPDRHCLAAAYRHADANVLTNADCREAAWCLGLDEERLRFIPHPLDTDFFCPETRQAEERDGRAADVRANVLGSVEGAELLLLAPARQSQSAETGAKRNDRIFHALRRYIDEAEPAGKPRAVLVAGGWGNPPDVRKSEALVERLGLGGRVIWLPVQPKHRMRALYRAADVVLDQFSEQCGSFGTVTAEALACGKPVITYVNGAAHEWCWPRTTVPPVHNALTAPEIYSRLLALAANPEWRAESGADGRAWVEREHSWRHVATDHLGLYAEVLGVPAESLKRAGQSAPAAAAPEPAQMHWTDVGAIGTGTTAVPPAVPELVAAGAGG